MSRFSLIRGIVFPGIALVLVLTGGGCRSKKSSQTVEVPSSISSSTTARVTSTIPSLPSIPQVLTDKIEAWRGPFLGAQESLVWLVTHEDAALENRPRIRGVFTEYGSLRRGGLAAHALTENGFGFSVNWGPEEKDIGQGTTTRVRLPDGREALTGELVMEGSRRTFELSRATNLPSFVLRRVATSTKEGEKEACVFSAEYPQLLSLEGIPEGSRKQINTKIVQYIQSDQAALSLKAGQFMKDCLTSRAELRKAKDPSVDQLHYVETIEPDVVFVNDKTLSLQFLDYSYTGGAHGNYGYRTLTFDLRTGKELFLEDLVKADHLREFYQRVSALLLREHREDLFESSVQDIQKFLDDRTSTTTEAQRAQYGKLPDWYVVENGIVFFYNPYEIASYAAGVREVRFSYSDWEDLALPGTRERLSL